MPIKEFKSKIFHWLNEPKWWNRVTLYLTLCLVIITVLQIVFSYRNFLHTDVDSARYMLSALIQGEFAVVTLVVTLSLIAMQLMAQTYSPRIIERFKRMPDLWILIVIYGFAIFSGLLVLKLIEKMCPLINSQSNIECYVALSYYFGVFAFVALVPYLWLTFKLLKPSTVTDMLAEEITMENIFNAAKKKSDDPIQPIIDIVCGALTKHDLTTVKDGLRAIRGRVKQIFERMVTFNGDTEEGLFKCIFVHLTRVGKLAADEDDEESIREVIIAMHEIGESAARRKLTNTTLQAIKSIGDLGVKALENRWDSATKLSVDSLGNLYVAACINEILGREVDNAFVTGIQNIASVSTGRDLRFAIDSVVPSLKDLCLKIIEKCLKEIKMSSKCNMYSTIRNTIDLDIATVGIGNILSQALGDKVIDEKSRKFEEIVKYIAEIGAEIAVVDNLEYVDGTKTDINLNGEDWCTDCLKHVFKWAIDNEKAYMIKRFVMAIGNFSNEISSKYTGGFYSDASEINNIRDRRESAVKYCWTIRLLKIMGAKAINKDISKEIIEEIKSLEDKIGLTRTT